MEGPIHRADPDEAERLHRFAHDLRNRLGGLKQALDQLASPDADPDLLDFAERQYFKALRAVEQLLDDRGVERGVGKVNREAIVFDQLVRRCAADLSHRFQRKEQTWELEATTSVTVQGDPYLLGELVSALLSNASKYSPAGSPIQARLTAADGQLDFRVRDQGVGLDADDLREVFIRYALLKSRSTDGEPQGRGTLGRAHQWAQAHGGSLEAMSDGPGKGAEFVLRLPV